MRVRATRLFAISGGGRRGQSVFAGAAAAYSLRIPFGSNYNGPLARVRRSNDNAELDIFAGAVDANGNRFIDTTALLAFTGANSAFVTTLSDQSGGARHATQATAANQPRIVNAGVVDTFNSRPAMFFNSTTTVLIATVAPPATYPLTMNTVGGVSAAATSIFLLVGGASNGVAMGVGLTGASLAYQGLKNGVAYMPTSTSFVANQAAVTTAIIPTGFGTTQMFFNGSAATILGGATNAPTAITSGTISIGAIFSGTAYIQEATYGYSTYTTEQRQALERNQGTAYGITVL
jgi:hypothetical protein